MEFVARFVPEPNDAQMKLMEMLLIETNNEGMYDLKRVRNEFSKTEVAEIISELLEEKAELTKQKMRDRRRRR